VSLLNSSRVTVSSYAYNHTVSYTGQEVTSNREEIVSVPEGSGIVIESSGEVGEAYM